MPREVTWGTPDRTRRLPPRRRRAFSALWLLLAAGFFAALFLAHAAGRRQVAAPGRVSSRHAASEARCEECHAPGDQPDGRCQRCHDSASTPRHTNIFHARAGGPEAAKPALVSPRCGGCHVEHRGREVPLTAVDEAHCVRCHFASPADHPEFAVLRDRRHQDPGLQFSHEVHVKKVLEQRSGQPYDTCAACHPSAGSTDLEPVSFDRHCASCHAKSGSLGATDPVPPAHVETPQSVTEFQSSGDRIAKVVVRHRDEWVLGSLRRLRRELEPEAVLAERGARAAQVARLRWRLARGSPLAGLDISGLRSREAEIGSELALLDARERGSAPGAPLAWLDEATRVAAADPVTAADAATLRSLFDGLAGKSLQPAPLDPHELEARRAELLAVLSALEAEGSAVRPKVDDLRRRLLALRPGEPSTRLLQRAREQRLGEQEQVRDEIRLRESGVPAAAALPAEEEHALREALLRAETRLRDLAEPGAREPARATGDDKRQTLEALAAPCVTCHGLEGGGLASPAPARAVLVHGRFPHASHLGHATCEKCHAGVEASKASSDLTFRGFEVCRECHRRGRAPEGCLSCHDYHPRAEP